MSKDPKDIVDHPGRKRLALRHALFAPRSRRGLEFADRSAAQFRRNLENLVIEKFGEVGLYHAALIHSASEAMRMASINRTEKRVAGESGKLSPELGLAFDRDYTRHLDLRDRKLEQLGIDKRDPKPLFDLDDPFPQLPAIPARATSPEPHEGEPPC